VRTTDRPLASAPPLVHHQTGSLTEALRRGADETIHKCIFPDPSLPSDLSDLSYQSDLSDPFSVLLFMFRIELLEI